MIDLTMYEPLTRQQWLICTAVTLAFCLYLNRVFGVPWRLMSYSVTSMLVSGWVSYAAYLQSVGRPMFSWGKPRRQSPRQFSRNPRTIQANPRSRMAQGKKGRIPPPAPPPPRVVVPDVVPVKPPSPMNADPRSRMAQGKKGRIPPPQPKRVTPQNPPTLNPEEAALMNRLINLTYDPQTAQRLALGVRSKYPGRSRTWQLEKAIADLERDRLR